MWPDGGQPAHGRHGPAPQGRVPGRCQAANEASKQCDLMHSVCSPFERSHKVP